MSNLSSGNRDNKKMLLKFQSKSARVKGLSFHPQRPWILASLHNGTIQLWDWRMEVLIDKFEEHDGPVRGIHFHPTQPLFVSGGDDYKIKVWNYQQRRCLFTLYGHLDYIRTVFFHPELPWILSASDDQTIRIWNWQNRQCLAVLTGHNHYVMCAQWHPTENLIVSASLDASVRVWDFTPLRERMGGAGKSGLMQTSVSNQSDEFFGPSDVIVKHAIEAAHSRGVNWASFHRTLPLIVSGADDREVKVWRYNDVKAWEVDSLRGHMNNVSCVLFHPKKDIILSNSEDKTIRVWDLSQGQSQTPLVFRRDDNRFWVLEAHPNLNLLAAGHDSGLIVFKLNRERPAYDISTSLNSSVTPSGPQTHTHTHLYYIRDVHVYEYNLRTQKERPVLTLRRRAPSSNASAYGTATSSSLSSYFKTLSYCDVSATHHAFLLTSDVDGSYELYHTLKNGQSSDESIPQKGFCKQAVIVSRSRFAILDKQRNLWLKNMKNETKKKVELGAGVNINAIFYGGVGRLLLRASDTNKSESKIILYDVHAMRVVSELPCQSRHAVKYAVWSADHKHLAMFSKANIYLTNHKMEEAVCVNENSRIKSGAWDPLGVFVYTTHTHIKYVLPNGESGVLRTLEQPVYAVSVLPASPSHSSAVPLHQLRTLVFLERATEKPSSLLFESTEYQFKDALIHQKNSEVKKLLESGRIKGESMISYLEKKGYPDVALQFVSDTTTKFLLALSCGNIDVALECAQQLDMKGEGQEAWKKLGQEALRQGNIQVVEAAYLKTKSFSPLSFLYLITGQQDKLVKMKQIAVSRGDLQGRFMNSLYLGDISERIAVLRESGQLALAYTTAVAHGLEEQALAIREELGGNIPDLESIGLFRKPPTLFMPPTPLLKQSNWPLLDIKRGFFDRDEKHGQLEEEKVETVVNDDELDFDLPSTNEQKQSGWGDDLDVDLPNPDTKTKSSWSDDLDFDIETAEEEVPAHSPSSSSSFVMPLPGKTPPASIWSSSPHSLPGDLIAAGQFDMAMHMLKRECGIVNFTPLKDMFMSVWQGSRVQAPLSPFGLPYSSSLPLPLVRNQADPSDVSRMPESVIKLSHAVELLRNGSKMVGEGQFQQAQNFFTQLLHCLPLIRVDKRSQQSEVIELLNVAREYLLFLRLETARREAQANPSINSQTRAAALACYLTHCVLQPKHTLLALRVALKCCYTIKNLKTSALICRKIIELAMQHAQTFQSDPKDAELVDTKKIRAILAQCEKVNTDENPFDYPDFLVLCSKSLVPIARSSPVIRCAYCNAIYMQKEDQTLCVLCGLAKAGDQATGLRNFSE